PRPRPRAGRRQDRALGRARAREGARGEGLRGVHAAGAQGRDDRGEAVVRTGAPPPAALGHDSLVDRAHRVAAVHEALEPSWLRARRGDALARFTEEGFPSSRDEAWRSTSLAKIASGSFEGPDPTLEFARSAIEPFLLRLHGGISLVFV